MNTSTDHVGKVMNTRYMFLWLVLAVTVCFATPSFAQFVGDSPCIDSKSIEIIVWNGFVVGGAGAFLARIAVALAFGNPWFALWRSLGLVVLTVPIAIGGLLVIGISTHIITFVLAICLVLCVMTALNFFLMREGLLFAIAQEVTSFVVWLGIIIGLVNFFF